MSISPLSIAIIGGGVSGLSTAYYLQQAALQAQRPLSITVFEAKTLLGGNADTVVVDLGNYYGEKGGPQQAYLRWADLGVNDANLATYVHMKAIMEQIGYLQNMKPLQDTACYFAASGTRTLTDDDALTLGVSDPRFALSAADGGLLEPLMKVVHQTALNLLDTIAPDYTVADYFDACIASPYTMLSAAALQLNISIDWNDPALPQRVAQVRDELYYPRISAMYFTDPRGPAGMPLQSPFQYYQVQEGGVTPQRCYFDHGAQHWLDALAGWITSQSTALVSVSIQTGSPANVYLDGNQVLVGGQRDTAQAYDLCVTATHADDTLALLNWDDANSAWAGQAAAILSTVRYSGGYAVCHTASARLPPNRNTWRTYNIPMRPASNSVYPYEIDYVVNLHQNDPANPQYNQAGLPQYFVSLVDDLNQVPYEDMLDRVLDPQRLPPELRARLPQLQAAAAGSGYRHQARMPHAKLQGKAWTWFKHNILDAGCLAAQQAIAAVNTSTAQSRGQGLASPALFFGGGWVYGAGLQEQCLIQSQILCALILGAAPAAATENQRADAGADRALTV